MAPKYSDRLSSLHSGMKNKYNKFSAFQTSEHLKTKSKLQYQIGHYER